MSFQVMVLVLVFGSSSESLFLSPSFSPFHSLVFIKNRFSVML